MYYLRLVIPIFHAVAIAVQGQSTYVPPTGPMFPTTADECDQYLRDYQDVLNRLDKEIQRTPQRGPQVKRNSCCFEWAGRTNATFCTSFESTRALQNRWYCMSLEKDKTFSACREQVSRYELIRDAVKPSMSPKEDSELRETHSQISSQTTEAAKQALKDHPVAGRVAPKAFEEIGRHSDQTLAALEGMSKRVAEEMANSSTHRTTPASQQARLLTDTSPVRTAEASNPLVGLWTCAARGQEYEARYVFNEDGSVTSKQGEKNSDYEVWVQQGSTVYWSSNEGDNTDERRFYIGKYSDGRLQGRAVAAWRLDESRRREHEYRSRNDPYYGMAKYPIATIRGIQFLLSTLTPDNFACRK